MKLHVLILLFFASTTVSAKSAYPKLLVVSYDGFRYDYLDMYHNITKNLNKLKRSSTYAKCLLNVFPTQTFPNHFSLATGVYTEVHGVIGSEVYSKGEGRLKYGDALFHYKKDIVPIWTLNEIPGEGRHSGVIMWPGSDFKYQGKNTTFNVLYNSEMSFHSRVSTAISWFRDEKTPANLVMLYFEEPDKASHAFGPHSWQNREQIKRVDEVTDYIMSSLHNNELEDVNVIFLSDHGMEPVTTDRIIDLNPVIGNISNMYGTSPVLQIYPKEGHTVEKVYAELEAFANNSNHFKVYLKHAIPEHFHLKNCSRAPPILAVAEPTYAFQDLHGMIDYFAKKSLAPRNGTYGVHGYDPSDVNMHPYFLAHGPLFRKNYYAGELRTVDMYALFSHVLQLDGPQYQISANYSNVAKIFNSAAPIGPLHGLYSMFTMFLILNYYCV